MRIYFFKNDSNDETVVAHDEHCQPFDAAQSIVRADDVRVNALIKKKYEKDHLIVFLVIHRF